MKKLRKLKKGLAILLAIAMVVGLVPGVGTMKVSAAGITPSKPSGEGTANSPYQIGTAAELYWFAALVNGETSVDGVAAADKTACAELTQNITVNSGVLKSDGSLADDASGFTPWTPISTDDENPYTGTFDGNGYTISGLYFNDTSKNYIGLFGFVGSGSKLCNVGIVDSYFNGRHGIGGVCGYCISGGEITNCYNAGTVIGTGVNIGGVCGYNNGTITDCYNTGNVSGTSTSNQEGCVGGVCGCNSGYTNMSTITRSYNSGKVSGGYCVGGVCGANGNNGPAKTINCYNTGEVTGTNDFVGGICGYNGVSDSRIENCYNSAAVSGSSYVGSVCGLNHAVITTCYYLTTESELSGVGESGTNAVSNAHGKTAGQFNSGEVCYLLNASEEVFTWRQNLNSDNLPVLDESHGKVYASAPCPAHFSNSQSDLAATEHSYKDGVCEVCGEVDIRPEMINGVYQLTTSEQLYWFAEQVNGNNKDQNAVLLNDIIVNSGEVSASTEDAKVWKPIGNDIAPYTGTFDGKGHTISGLYFNDTSESSGQYVGLFGKIGSGGSVSNVNVTNSYFNGYEQVGGICGRNEGSIANCHVQGILSAKSLAGGVCGYNGGTITNCYNTGTVSGVTSRFGGVCGQNYGTITNCYNTGTVSCPNYKIGGVCGSNSETIKNCYYLSGTADGGILGSDVTGSAESKTETQFKSGEVAYLLNEGKSEENVVWRQNLGETEADATPVLDGSHKIVYASKPCEIEFANTEFATEKPHNVTKSEDGTSHTCSVCKKTEQHSDVATFTVNETNHSITAICPSCGDLGTITLSASNATYDGMEKAASISDEIIKGFTTPDIVYEKKAEDGSFATIDSTPKDAGTYRASITYTVDADNSKVYTVSTEYTIARRPVTITADNMSMTYGETEPALSYKVSDDTPLVNDEALEGTLSREAGEDAGTYKITQGTVTNDTNQNYDITFSEGTFTINKANKQSMGDFTIEYCESGGKCTVSIDPIQDAEYKFDIGNSTGNWTDNSSISGIEHNTQVTGRVRYKGDNNHNPGPEAYKQITTGHGGDFYWVPEEEASCTENGHYEHWYCDVCKRYYRDGLGTIEVQESEITKVAPGHIDEHDDGVCDMCNAIVNDYKHLQLWIEDFKNIQQNNYSDASYQTLQKALEEAQKLTAENSKEELTAAFKALIAARDGLKLTALIVGTVANPSDTGKQTGGGKYAVGETVTLTAEGVNDWTFNGWYDSKEKLVSDKAEVTFTVTEDMNGTVSYTAKYTHVNHTMDENSYTCSVCGTSYYKVTFTGAVESERYTTGNVEFPAGDYIFKVGEDVIDTSDYTISENTRIIVESLAQATKHVVTITGDAHCTLTVTDSNGNTVVNEDEVAAGTILKVSVKVDDGYTLTTTPESSYTVSEATTIKAVTEAKTYAVTVDDTYYKNGKADAPTASVDNLPAVPYGTSLTLTAADANSGYEFLGWYQTNGKQLTAEIEYTVTITSALTVQPRYQQNSGTVTFVANGIVVDTIENATESTAIVFPSDVTAATGYEFVGWDKTEAEIQESIRNSENVVVTACFESIKENYTVTIYNGENETPEIMNLTESKYINVEAVSVNGKEFAYWLVDGQIQSYRHSLAIKITQNCTIQAVYSFEQVEENATSLLKSASYNDETHKIAIVAYLSVPDGANISKAGLIAASGTSSKYNANDDLTFDNADYIKSGSNAANYTVYTYTWSKTSVCVGDVWYARAYVIYTDSNGNEKTVYGDRVKIVAGTEYDYSEKATAKITSVSYNGETQKAAFVAYHAVPDGAVIEKAGLIAKAADESFDPKLTVLTTSNADYIKCGSNASLYTTYTYTWSKTKVNAGDTWYARAYLVYKDSNGQEHTLYGDLVTLTAN